ncbi:hypothetical protein [Pedobacter sp. SYP-B3415]|uniref:hypothetical protein n=1 Tax=Pedobacter sp. SYP-B3415 TaxID=2496641 RepID=UPI00101BA12E|nr:hypothetical protein [Pedobacter sp. SYP-B3415]
MQDNDFDNLFRERFENAAVEPKKDLWAGISQELEPKKRRLTPVYWSAAAVVLLGVGIAFLFRPEEKVQLTAHNKPQRIKPQAVQDASEQTATQQQVSRDLVKETPAVQPEKSIVTEERKPTERQPEEAAQPKEQHAQPETMIAATDTRRENNTDVTGQISQPETVIARVEQPQSGNDGFRTKPAFPEAAADRADENEPKERGARREKGLFAFVGKVKEKFDKTTKNIITEKNGTMSIDLGFVKIDKEIN